MRQIKFLKTFLSDVNVASLSPTSLPTINKVCSNIDFSKDLTIVEYGPGTGACTSVLLKHMTQGSKLLTIETNLDFINHLNIIKDKRLVNIQGSAHDVLRILTSEEVVRADYVISSIPFTFFTDKQRTRLVSDTYQVIAPGGAFIVYQYSPLMRKYLKVYFDEVTLKYSHFNIPGYFIMIGTKNKI